VPGAALICGLARITLGDIVHGGCPLQAQRGQLAARHVGFGGWGDEGHLLFGHRREIAIGDQLGVADHEQPPTTGQLLQLFHGPDDLSHLARAAVEDAREQRDGAVPGDGDPGLDLLEIGAAILGMAVLGGREPLGDLVIVAVQGDRGHVPAHPGSLDAERLDRGQSHRPDQVIKLRGDRVQGPADPIVVEQFGIDTEHLAHRPGSGPLLHVHQRRGRGQPVGDQHLDNLPMSEFSQVTHRTGGIHQLPDPQPGTKLGHHRQRPEHLLHTRATELRSLSHTPRKYRLHQD
jgi:hypothetical protein